MEIKKRKTAMVKRICLTCGKEFEAQDKLDLQRVTQLMFKAPLNRED